MHSKGKPIAGVQGLRALAAFLVLLQHSIYFTCVVKQLDYFQFNLINFGRVGVFLFFAISGYVMILCLAQGKFFMLNRIARIYPSFWIAILMSGFIFHFIGRPWVFNFYSMTLLPDANANNSYQIPYWTLMYEIFFYLMIYIFILCNFSHKQIFYSLLIWTGIIIFASQFQLVPAYNPQIPGKWMLFSPICLVFITGALYGLMGRDKIKNIPTIFLCIIASLFFVLITSKRGDALASHLQYVCWSIACVLVLELSQRLKHIPAFLEKLGDYSYGFYLVHVIFITVAMYIITQHSHHHKFLSCFIFIMCISAIGGMAFGVFDHYFYKTKIKPWVNEIKTLLANSNNIAENSSASLENE